jgi:hypothetical protein
MPSVDICVIQPSYKNFVPEVAQLVQLIKVPATNYIQPVYMYMGLTMNSI